PTWLAPIQVQAIPVSDIHMDYVRKVEDELKESGIRVHVDVRDEKLGYKIRGAQMQKIPYILVLGDKEIESNSVNVRRYGQKETKIVKLEQFIQNIKDDIESKGKNDEANRG